MGTFLHHFPVFSHELNRLECHRLQLPCARIMSIERWNADPLGDGSALGDVSQSYACENRRVIFGSASEVSHDDGAVSSNQAAAA
jgi:hypothetical protein